MIRDERLFSGGAAKRGFILLDVIHGGRADNREPCAHVCVCVSSLDVCAVREFIIDYGG